MAFKASKNRIWEKINNGVVPIGPCMYTGNESIVEIIGLTGFDFQILDTEHSRINTRDIENLIRAAESVGLATIVRVPQNEPYLIRQAMEAGAQAVMIPHVCTIEDVKKAQNSLRYPPIGKAGICPSIRSANYSFATWGDYVEACENVMLIPLIEDPAALPNLEGILAELKPGRDAIWFGRADYAQNLAIRDENGKITLDPPIIYEAFDQVLKMANKADIPVMATPFPETDPDGPQKTVAKGAKMLVIGIDQTIFYEACEKKVKYASNIEIKK